MSFLPNGFFPQKINQIVTLLLAFILIYFAVSFLCIFFAMVFFAVQHPFDYTNSTEVAAFSGQAQAYILTQWWINYLVSIFGFLIPMAYVIRKSKLAIQDFFALKHANRLSFPSVFLLILVSFLFAFVITPVVEMFPVSPLYQAAVQKFFDNWYLLPLPVVFAPVLEELFFRGVIFRALLFSQKPWLAMITSALVFATVHANVTQFIAAFLFGIFLAWVYYHVRSIYLNILLHFLQNSAAALFFYFQENPFAPTHSFFPSIAYYFVIYLLAFVFLGVLLNYFVKLFNKWEKI